MLDDDSLIDLVDQCLDRLADGGELDPVALKERAGDQWPELLECVNLALDLQGASALLTEEATPVPLPDRIHRFEVVRLLGEGGFSRVYLALDPTLGRAVAVKVLGYAGVSRFDRAELLRREANALACVRHPSIVEVFEYLELDDFALVVMEFIPGPTLEVVLDHLRGGSVDGAGTSLEITQLAEELATPMNRVRVVHQLALALADCHGRGVIHRDLKPRNVLLPFRDGPKLIDFGISHMPETEAAGVTESLIGTAGYMSPEQLERGSTGASAASEIYSFGVLAYEVISLSHPWGYGAPPRWGVPPESTMIPTEVSWILQRAMAPEPEQRYGDMAALAADLGSILEGRRPSAEPPTFRSSARRWARQHARALGAIGGAVLAAVLLLMAGSMSWLGHQRGNLEAELAGIAADVELVSSLADAEEVLERLDPWRERARRWDGTRGRSLVFRGIEQRGTELRGRLLEQGESILIRATESALERGFHGGAHRNILDLFTESSGFLVPAGPKGRSGRCRLHTGGGARVFQIPMDHPLPLEPIVRGEYLPVGRYVLVDDTTGAESTEVVLPGQLVCTPKLLVPAAHWTERMVTIDPGQLDEGVPEALRTMAAIELFRSDVTIGDLAPILGEQEMLRISNTIRAVCPALKGSETLDGSVPFLGTGFQAHLIARRLGLRVPTYAELCVAAAAGELPLRDEEGDSIDYWSSTSSEAEPDGWVIARFVEGAGPGHATPRPPGFAMIDGLNTGARLRLVRTARRP